MNPSRPRQAVRMLQDRLCISERRACRYAGQHRSTQRHAPPVARRALELLLEQGYIEHGSPLQNPYVESFGSRVPDELLCVEMFSCLA